MDAQSRKAGSMFTKLIGSPWTFLVIAVLWLSSLGYVGFWQRAEGRKLESADWMSRDKAIADAKAAMIDAFREGEGHIAGVVEDKLKGLRANERIINNETIKIIDRPVYSNVCLDADGLRLIEAARAGNTDTGKPAH